MDFGEKAVFVFELQPSSNSSVNNITTAIKTQSKIHHLVHSPRTSPWDGQRRICSFYIAQLVDSVSGGHRRRTRILHEGSGHAVGSKASTSQVISRRASHIPSRVSIRHLGAKTPIASKYLTVRVHQDRRGLHTWTYQCHVPKHGVDLGRPVEYVEPRLGPNAKSIHDNMASIPAAFLRSQARVY